MYSGPGARSRSEPTTRCERRQSERVNLRPMRTQGGQDEDAEKRAEGIHGDVARVIDAAADDALEEVVAVADGGAEGSGGGGAGDGAGDERGHRAPGEPGDDAVFGEVRALEVVALQPGEGEHGGRPRAD